MTPGVRIRGAQRADVPRLFSMVIELAEYERARDSVVGDEALLERALFGDTPAAEAVVAELGGEVIGFALFCRTFSTWLCLPCLWLEDLYVSPTHRRAGAGRALLVHLAAVAVQRGCGRLEWAALSWNEPALRFYDALGAERMSEWETLRLDGAALRDLGAGAAALTE